MKTLILRDATLTTVVEIKADIFATNAEMTDPSFNTNFTAMEIKDEEAAIVLGINVNESKYDFKQIVAIAEGIAGIGLFVIDLQESAGEATIVAI